MLRNESGGSIQFPSIRIPLSAEAENVDTKPVPSNALPTGERGMTADLFPALTEGSK